MEVSDHDYKCSVCGKPQKRDNLTTKKVLFKDMGKGSETHRSRVVAWLCVSCMKSDPDYNIPAHTTPNERVRNGSPR